MGDKFTERECREFAVERMKAMGLPQNCIDKFSKNGEIMLSTADGKIIPLSDADKTILEDLLPKPIPQDEVYEKLSETARAMIDGINEAQSKTVIYHVVENIGVFPDKAVGGWRFLNCLQVSSYKDDYGKDFFETDFSPEQKTFYTGAYVCNTNVPEFSEYGMIKVLRKKGCEGVSRVV